MNWLSFALALNSSGLQESGNSLVRAEPIYSHSTIAPGAEGRIGVRLTVEKGWHIYWINPGDSGLATSLEWEEVKGMAVSKPLFPHPTAFVTPEGTTFGHEGEVTLFSRFRAAQRLNPGSSLTAKAKISWLVCKEACLPGEAVVPIRLRVATASTPTSQANALRAADIERNRAFPPGSVSARAEGKKVILSFRSLKLDKKVNNVRFYPSQPGMVSHSAPQTFEEVSGGLDLKLTVSEFGGPSPLIVAGVLEFTTSEGVERRLVPPTTAKG
jgi:DsbC/DsbD-like thiol-disulfide interchange protein